VLRDSLIFIILRRLKEKLVILPYVRVRYSSVYASARDVDVSPHIASYCRPGFVRTAQDAAVAAMLHFRE